MGRRSLAISSECVYHVVNRSNNREWFYISIKEAWEVFGQVLRTASWMYGTEIHTFVLMSNHYHLIVAAPHGNLSAFMRYFQTEVCREVQRRAKRINHVFGNRYKGSALWTSASYAIVYKYVLRNPVKAKLCSRVEDYPFSTFNETVLGQCQVPTVERIDEISAHVPRRLSDRLGWLNQPTKPESDELVRKALRRGEFRISRGNEVRRQGENLWKDYQVPAP